jgi:hypothetical protein
VALTTWSSQTFSERVLPMSFLALVASVAGQEADSTSMGFTARQMRR